MINVVFIEVKRLFETIYLQHNYITIKYDKNNIWLDIYNIINKKNQKIHFTNYENKFVPTKGIKIDKAFCIITNYYMNKKITKEAFLVYNNQIYNAYINNNKLGSYTIQKNYTEPLGIKPNISCFPIKVNSNNIKELTQKDDILFLFLNTNNIANYSILLNNGIKFMLYCGLKNNIIYIQLIKFNQYNKLIAYYFYNNYGDHYEYNISY